MQYKDAWKKDAVEYHSALKRKEILMHATSWINLEDIMLSKLTQSQEDK